MDRLGAEYAKLLSITDRTGYQLTLQYDVQVASQLLSVADSYGRSISFGYDGSGHLATVTDPAQGTWTYAYTGPNLTSAMGPDGHGKLYEYEDIRFPSALTGVTDENNVRFATISYDDTGRASQTQHAGGAELTSLTYGGSNTTVAEGSQTPKTYAFTAPFTANHLVGITQGTASSSKTYDTNGFLASSTDFNGNVTTYTYDTRGLEESRTEASGTPLARTITTQWHPNFRLPTEIDEPGRRTVYTYDSNGNRLSQTITDTATGESRTTTWTYTGYGQVATVDGARTDVSDVTHYDYDTHGNLIKITDALGHITQIPQQDPYGNPTKIVDPNGVITTLVYDARQRLKTKTVAGATTSFDYDYAGQLVKVTLPDGSYIQYTYDPAHRLTDIADNQGNYIHYTLDVMGNRTAENVYDSGNTLRRAQGRVFDDLGRLKQITNAGNQVVTEYGYDAQGNRTSQIDGGDSAFTTLFQPDALNRVQQVTDPANGTTKYGYDSLSQLVSVTDPTNLLTSYTLDAFGEAKQQASPDTGVSNYSYDSAGNRRTQIDARGVQVSYSYDALNRLAFVDYPGTDEDVAYSYDGSNYSSSSPYGFGRLTGIQEANGARTTTLFYDADGNVVEEDRVIDGFSYSTLYTYNAADRLTSITYPTGRVVTYERDSAGRVSRVTNAMGGVTTTLASNIRYMPFGPIASYTMGNGVVVNRTYDTDYHLAEYQDGSIQDVHLYYDLRNNIEATEDVLQSARSQTFGYDNLSRLTSANGAYGTLGYGYDAVGDRTSASVNGTANTYSYNANTHRLSSITGGTTVDFSYDANGNVTAKGGLGLGYNNANRQYSATANATSVNSAYNAFGQRVKKTVGTQTTVLHYDREGHLLAETDPNSPLKREYVWLEGQPLYIDSVALRPETIVDNSDPGFSMTGAWTSDTTYGGYLGVDYLSHQHQNVGRIAVDDSTGLVKTSTGVWYEWQCKGVLAPNGGCVNGNMSISPPTTGTERSFTWTANLPWAGRYMVSAVWWSGSDRSKAATYSFDTTTGAKGVLVDQTKPGNIWESLGFYDFGSGAHSITLTAAPGDGYLIADAIGFTPVTTASGAPVGDEAHWAPPENQTYQVFVRWPDTSGSINTNEAFYRIKHSGGETDLTLNQQKSSRQWNLLGTFTFSDLQSQGVFLATDPDRVTVADAVRFVPTGSSVYEEQAAYYHVDQLGTPQKLSDQNGSVIWDAVYEPFGDANLVTNQVTQPLRLPGQYYDSETGLYQNWHRDYDPSIGRYLQSDPIGLRGGISTYGYGGGNPVTHIDPTGLKCVFGVGCWTTPDERAFLDRGDYLGYYGAACANFDSTACFDRRVAADEGFWAHRATKRLLDALRDRAKKDNQCIDEPAILEKIRSDLANDYANSLPSSQDAAHWPRVNDVVQYHWDEFAEFGLEPSTFGGTPLGPTVGPIGESFWCPNCQ